MLYIIAALLASAWFAGAETTFLSFNKARFQAWLHRGDRGTRAVDFLNRNPERFLTTTLAGNNLANVFYSSMMAIWLSRHGFSEHFILVIAPVILLIFGEAIPKVIARQMADKSILIVGSLLFYLRVIMLPLVKIIELVMSRIQQRLGLSDQLMGQAFSRIEIASELNQAGQDGLFDENTSILLKRFFRFSERRVKDIMTPRTAVVALSQDTPVSEARRRILESGFTRLPCYEENIDNITGLLAAPNLLAKPEDLKSVILPFLVVPSSLSVIKLISWMKKHRTGLVGALDEYGGFAGIVTVDDIAQELVGLIRDEYDTGDRHCIRLSKKVWLVHGRTRISMLMQNLGFDVFDTRASSVGGALNQIAGRIPKAEDEFDLPSVNLRVINASPREVGLIKITLKESPQNTSVS